MTETLQIDALLSDVAARLEAVSDSPRLDAEIILSRAIDMSRSYLFAHPEDVPDVDARARLEQNVARRLAGEPMAYITGSKEFWSLQLMVSPATLVPRPETELLVELALREIPQQSEYRVLDLGTGSGAIAVAIAKQRPLATITAVDVSGEALKIAEQNARQLELGNVRCLSGDWTEPVRDAEFDLIVSNPPYIRDDDPALKRLHREPRLALAAGPDGLNAIKHIARDCRSILNRGGVLMLEHGADQRQAVAAILDANGWSPVECHIDFGGLPRVTIARKP